MTSFRLALLALIGLLPLPPLAAQELSDEPLYLYQRINVLVAHHDNRMSLRVWSDGTVDMRFPAYTPQAGHYRWTASAQELAELDVLFATVGRHDSNPVETALARRSDGELILIADADLLRFEVRSAGRAPQVLMVEAPEAWSDALPESDELEALARTESELLEWMRQRAREPQR